MGILTTLGHSDETACRACRAICIVLMPSGDNGRPRKNGTFPLAERQWRDIASFMDLSARQLQIVRCIFDGCAKEATIARRLRIAPSTVHPHLNRLHRKVSAATRCDVILRVFAVHVMLTSTSDID